jgi:hypothetical protein
MINIVLNLCKTFGIVTSVLFVKLSSYWADVIVLIFPITSAVVLKKKKIIDTLTQLNKNEI